MISLLPGPVQVAPHIREAFERAPVSHRNPEFIGMFQQVRAALGDLVGGVETALFCGSGTLANDAVAAALSARGDAGQGLVLSNGEFGERLVRHAECAGLEFDKLAWQWGRAWDFEQVRERLSQDPLIRWIWAVHLESSTGVLNDIERLQCIAAENDVHLCLDCVSSVGAVPLDLRRASLATGASGKALGAYCGIAIVFVGSVARAVLPGGGVASSLDIRDSVEAVGPRHTFPSPQLYALHSALDDYSALHLRTARYDSYAALGDYVGAELRRLGVPLVAPDSEGAPTITTFESPTESSEAFVNLARTWGFEIAGHSAYLAERGWCQIGTMGDVKRLDLEHFFDRWRIWVDSR